MYEIMIVLILKIAVEIGVPPYFALSIALEENWTLNPNAQSLPNADGSTDLGIMQLNSRYYGNIDWRDPEINIRAGIQHIKALMQKPELNTYWSIACAYNCGASRFIERGPPLSSTYYADRVMKRYRKFAEQRTIEYFEVLAM